jgi:hypothetical protein
MAKYIVHCKFVFSVQCYLFRVSVQSPCTVYFQWTSHAILGNDDTMTIAVRRYSTYSVYFLKTLFHEIFALQIFPCLRSFLIAFL